MDDFKLGLNIEGRGREEGIGQGERQNKQDKNKREEKGYEKEDLMNVHINTHPGILYYEKLNRSFWFAIWMLSMI